MRNVTMMVVLALLVVNFVGCKIDKEEGPVIVGITPESIMSHLPFTIEVSGSGFTAESVIVYDSRQMETEFVSEELLRCSVSAQYTPGAADGNNRLISVYVRQGTSGEQSAAFTITIKETPGFREAVTVYAAPEGNYYWDNLKIIAAGDSRLYTVWHQGASTTDPVISGNFLSVSQDNGQTWSEPKEIPALEYIAADGDNLYAWEDDTYDVYFYRSVDRGDTWTSMKLFSWDIRLAYWFYILHGIAAGRDASGNLYVVSGETSPDGSMTLTTRVSTDNGITWGIKRTQGFDNSALDYYPFAWMAMNTTGGICVGYDRSGLYEINTSLGYFYSQNSGASYAQLDRGTESCHRAFLNDDANLYLLTDTMFGENDYKTVFFKGSDYGATPLILTDFGQYSDKADLGMDMYGNLFIVGANQVIRSADDGVTWTQPVEYSSNQQIYRLSMTTSADGQVYFTWIESFTGPDSDRIYFTAGQ